MAKLDEKVFLAALAERFADYVPANTAKAILSDIRAELENYHLVTVIPGTPAADETEDLVKLWLNAKTVEGLSAKSIEQYEYCLGRIRQDIGVPFGKLTIDHVRKYVADELKRGVAKTTVSRAAEGGGRMKRKTFKKWLMSIGGISRNDADYICEMVVRHDKSYGVVYSKIVADPWLSEMLDIILNAELPKEG